MREIKIAIENDEVVMRCDPQNVDLVARLKFMYRSYLHTRSMRIFPSSMVCFRSSKEIEPYIK